MAPAVNSVVVEAPAPMRLALAGLSLCMLMASLDTSITNVALPTLTHAFGASFQAVQWVVLAYLLAITTLIVSVGRLGDLVGHRRLLLTGIILFAGASVLCGVAPALWLLVAARGAQGIGAAIMLALSLAFVGEIVPKERTGSAMGLLGTTSAVGTAFGPSLGGVLIAGFGWRSIFLANVPAAAVALWLAHRHLPADRPRSTERPRFDLHGTMLLALALGAYALAMTMGHGQFGARNGGLLLIAVAGTGLFVVTESHASSPLIQLAMVRDSALRAGLGMSALVSTVMMATLVVGPFYLTRALGLGSARVGLVMSVGPLVVALTGIPAGRLVDRIGSGRMTKVGLSAMVAGAALLVVLPASLGIKGYLAPIVVITVGYGLFQTTNNTAVMKDVDQRQRGVVSGLLSLSRNLGLITGASVMGAIFAHASGSRDLAGARPSDVAAGMHASFAVATMLLVFALVLAARCQAHAARAVNQAAALPEWDREPASP